MAHILTNARCCAVLPLLCSRFGDSAWKPESADKLKSLLETAIQRRFPKVTVLAMLLRGLG